MEELNQLFDIAITTIIEDIKTKENKNWKNDYQFYLNQKTYPQTQIMDGWDRVKVKMIASTNKKLKQQRLKIECSVSIVLNQARPRWWSKYNSSRENIIQAGKKTLKQSKLLLNEYHSSRTAEK